MWTAAAAAIICTGHELGACRRGSRCKGEYTVIRINELKIPLDGDEQELPALAAKALKIPKNDIESLSIFKNPSTAAKRGYSLYLRGGRDRCGR